MSIGGARMAKEIKKNEFRKNHSKEGEIGRASCRERVCGLV